MTIAAENLPDDIAALKQIIADLTGDAVVAKAEIAKLKFQLRVPARRVRPVLGTAGPRHRPARAGRSRPSRPTGPNGWRHSRRPWRR
jgi:hypothetical protein